MQVYELGKKTAEKKQDAEEVKEGERAREQGHSWPIVSSGFPQRSRPRASEDKNHISLEHF